MVTGWKGQNKRERKKQTETQNAALHYLQQFSSFFFDNKCVKWRTSSNVWFNTFPQTQSTPKHMDMINLSLSCSLPDNPIVLMQYFDFIDFSSPRGDPLSWRTVTHWAIGLTVCELSSFEKTCLYRIHGLKCSVHLCQPLRTEKHFEPVLNSLFHWMFLHWLH